MTSTKTGGAYDRETIYSILDEAFICRVGFVSDAQPYVIFRPQPSKNPDRSHISPSQ